MEIHFGEIWFAETRSNKEHVQTGTRPYIIFSNEKCNEHSPIITAIPLTSNLTKKPLPTHCNIYSSNRSSIALCEQITTLNRTQLLDKIGECNEYEIRQLKICLMIQLNML